jgi:hypothetical protein
LRRRRRRKKNTREKRKSLMTFVHSLSTDLAIMRIRMIITGATEEEKFLFYIYVCVHEERKAPKNGSPHSKKKE